MSPSLCRRMTQDLQLAGLSDSTQDADLRIGRGLADHFHTPPSRLSEHQARDDLLHLQNDHWIVSCESGRVMSMCRNMGANRSRKMTLDAMEFLRRFLEHVLPPRFANVRHYGFLSPSASVSLELLRWLIAIGLGATHVFHFVRNGSQRDGAEGPRCPTCGGRLEWLGIEPALRPSAFDTS